jgi:N-carbamoyl-L-amino-acid hydrolase
VIRLHIDSSRLQQQIDDLAAISEAPAPVVTRVLFSEADLRGRAFIKSICSELGLSLRDDAVGNTFARWPGSELTVSPVATGSHIDAIPNAGRYDGVVGVLGALEAIRALKQAGFKPHRGIELIVFTAEEPTRFGIGCLGSRLLAGSLSADRVAALRDRDAHDLEYWRNRAGFASPLSPLLEERRSFIDSVRLPQNCYSAFIELHIEQGPILEKESIPIGIVEKIAAPSTLRLELTGVGGHAGAVLMPERHDALLAGAEIALGVEKAALNSGSPDTVATTGVFRIEPGAVNSVPCRAWLEIDLRDTQVATRDAALRKIEESVPEICRRRGVEFKIERLNFDAPAVCDPTLISAVLAACGETGHTAKRMISRAYHDSLFMAQICPTAMIFIPCRGGVSHRPDEYSSPEQIKAGVEVLAHTLVKLAD